MVRAHVEPDVERAFRLISPHPLADAMPGVYREAWIDDAAWYPSVEPFGPRFLAAFDDVLAPILGAIDNLDAYFDPRTTPEDFLIWLGGWVAATVDETWTDGRRRAFVSEAADLHRRRGTVSGLKEHVEVHTGATVQVIDNGASAWSATPGGKLPGTVQPLVVVRVVADDPTKVDQKMLAALVGAAKPAHVPHRVEVVGAASPPVSARSKAKPAEADSAAKASKAGGPPGSGTPPAAKPPAQSQDEDGAP